MDTELTRNDIVYLRWLDSALTPEWTKAPNEETGLSEIETIGYLVFEDATQIQVALSRFGKSQFMAIQAIPKSVIIERKKLD